MRREQAEGVSFFLHSYRAREINSPYRRFFEIRALKEMPIVLCSSMYLPVWYSCSIPSPLKRLNWIEKKPTHAENFKCPLRYHPQGRRFCWLFCCALLCLCTSNNAVLFICFSVLFCRCQPPGRSSWRAPASSCYWRRRAPPRRSWRTWTTKSRSARSQQTSQSEKRVSCKKFHTKYKDFSHMSPFCKNC